MIVCCQHFHDYIFSLRFLGFMLYFEHAAFHTAIYDRLLPTFPIRQIIDWRTYYGLWRFMIIFSLRFLGFMLYFEHTAFHILAAFIYAGVLLCWDGGFRLYMYPRVGLASSPVPARACSTTRSTMRVSSEDTESSDLHVHAGYPITN